MSSELISLFRDRYTRTKKSLGQHFLTNAHFISEIAAAVAQDNTPIVEIGPGCGVLTQALHKLSSTITVIDIDDIAIEFLTEHKDRFFPLINIVHSDVTKVDLSSLYEEKISIVGNLPYNVSVKILEHCTQFIDSISSMTFMFQKEVASRIMATPAHGKEYSSLSVYCDYHYDIAKIRDISGSNFWPNANVMSTVAKFTPKKVKPIAPSDEDKFFSFLRQSFQQKRKTLNNNLRVYKEIDLQNALEKLELSASVRAEQLTTHEFVTLFNLLFDI